MEIYHQLGWRYQWNLNSINRDHTGEGIIISPKHMRKRNVDSLDPTTKAAAIFDPQFFQPDFARGELRTYDFFPANLPGGFDTSAYIDSAANYVAERCVRYQIDSGFRYIVIPTRYYSGLPTDYIQNLENQFVQPFQIAIRNLGGSENTILQLLLNESMLKDENFSADILNWITGISDISGIYIITELSNRGKQIKDADFLYRFLWFVHQLVQNGIRVILGYLNTEAILLSLAEPHILTIGSFEKARIFNIRNFDATKQGEGGPIVRIYYSKLLQSIEHGFKDTISQSLADVPDLVDVNPYQIEIYNPTYLPHFQRPESYMHYFLVFSYQIRGIATYSGVERFSEFVRLVEYARGLYNRLYQAGVYLPAESDGSHLEPWLTAANQFASYRGWR